MTIELALDVFDILQDKYGADYFSDDEKLKLFNKAQYKYLSQVIPDNHGGRTNVEIDSNVAHNVQPLIHPLSFNTSSGRLTKSALQSLLVSASHAGATVLRILSFSATSGSNVYPVRWAKHNNIWEYYANVFKHPSAPDNMRFTIDSDGYMFYPTSDSLSMKVVVLRDPIQVSLSPSVNPEFSDYVVYEILSIMLEDAGVATRDDELMQAVRAAATR